MGERYVPNPKHKLPWQPGARGTLCPKQADGEKLFRTATQDPDHPGKRYNTDGDQAYCAQSGNVFDEDGNELWHGYPVNWRNVPAVVQRAWIADGRIPRLRLRG